MSKVYLVRNNAGQWLQRGAGLEAPVGGSAYDHKTRVDAQKTGDAWLTANRTGFVQVFEAVEKRAAAAPPITVETY